MSHALAFLPLTLAVALLAACDRPKDVEKTGTPILRKLEPMPKCREAQAGGPEELVKTLYGRYPRTRVFLAPEQELAHYFDDRLRAAIVEISDCKKSTDEAYTCMAPDIMYGELLGDASELKVCRMALQDGTVRVQFRDTDNGEPRSVSYKLTNTAGGWKISDVYYSNGLGKSSLLAEVSEYYSELAGGWNRAQAEEKPQTLANYKEQFPECPPATTGGPEDLVRALYRQYPWKQDRSIINEKREVLLNYLDENLTKLILRSQEIRAKKHAWYLPLPNLMINNNMESLQEVTGFRICAMDAAEKTVRVQFRNRGEPSLVAFKLTNTPAGWRISGIFMMAGTRSPAPSEEYDWSLAQELSKAP